MGSTFTFNYLKFVLYSVQAGETEYHNNKIINSGCTSDNSLNEAYLRKISGIINPLELNVLSLFNTPTSNVCADSWENVLSLKDAFKIYDMII